MPREYSRARRVEDQLQRLLVDLIRREIKDPRLGPVSITAVEVSNDLSHARVFVTPFGGIGDPAATVAALQHAAGFLRALLGRELRLRVTPTLEFHADESIERGARLSALINQAVTQDRDRHPDQVEPPGDPEPR
jgi:ribosome-binding factor A